MKPFLIFLLSVCCCISHAQTGKSTNRPTFHSINLLGFLNGEAGSEPLVQTINGIQVKTYSMGIGVGLDYYKQRSVPVFLDIRKNIFRKAQSPFVYLDGGYHFLWSNNKPKEWIRTNEKGGLYYDLGIGYSFPASKTAAVQVSFGYSVKNMSEKVNQYPWRSSWPSPEDYQQLNYTLRRYSFKMGLSL
ncbi:MAG TPA: hypothetical protein VD794_00765 [Flavisolibacter sp.]|nr:hypothetical protein [Flavisolibacter sp.]